MGIALGIGGEVTGWGGGGGDRGERYILCLRPAYMRSLLDLPFLEALYETRVGFDAGPVLLHKGKRELV